MVTDLESAISGEEGQPLTPEQQAEVVQYIQKTAAVSPEHVDEFNQRYLIPLTSALSRATFWVDAGGEPTIRWWDEADASVSTRLRLGGAWYRQVDVLMAVCRSTTRHEHR